MRPIQERTPTERIAENRYATRQLQRRPSTPPAAGVAACWLGGWDFDTTNAWPQTTFRNVANTTNNSYYMDSWLTTDSPGISYDFDDGITITEDGTYSIYGWVRWGENFSDGEIRITSLALTSFRHINVFNLNAAEGSIGTNRLPVAMTWMLVGTQTIKLEAWTSAASRTLLGAELMVVRHTATSDMTYAARP